MKRTRTSSPSPAGHQFAAAVRKALLRKNSKFESGADLARHLHIGTDFVSRVLAAERWPDLNAVPLWAQALDYHPGELVLTWLRDRTPDAHEAVDQLLRNGLKDTELAVKPRSLDLITRLSNIAIGPRRAIETLIEVLSPERPDD